MSIQEQPQVISEEEYLSQNGGCLMDLGEPALHKNIAYGSVRMRYLKLQSEKDRFLLEKREQLRKEYSEKVRNGEIRPPTRIEQLIRTAQGHPDNLSVQAARRILTKKKILWDTQNV